MSADAESELERAFQSARKLPEEERGAFLDVLAECHPDLASEVGEMLGLFEAAEREMPDSAVIADICGDAPGLMAESIEIDGFTVVEHIGSGSFGLVFLARQIDPPRDVALKVLRATMEKSAAARFEREAALLARLGHPGIATIHAAGRCRAATGEELSYIAIEYIPGAKTITAYAAEEQLSPRARIGLIVSLCEAVHHGHQRGVIHRDLKPANVLLSADGIVKVIDFGIARALDADASAELTVTGSVLGTIAYMSPEQARGERISIDVRTDVYAIGVLLFELVAGRLPHDLETLGWMEAARKISTEPVPRLTASVAGVAKDLEAIVSKATDFEPARRYGSLAEMADDLGAFLGGHAVAARFPTLTYRLLKTLRRHRVVAAAIALVLLTSIAATIITWSLYQRSERRGRLAANRADELHRQVYVTNLSLAQEALRDGEPQAAAERLDECAEELRGWEWHHLSARGRRKARLFRAYDGRVGTLAFLTNSELLSSGPADHLTLWNLDEMRTTRRFPGVTSLADVFEIHRGKRLLAAVDRAGFFCVWDFSGELTSRRRVMRGSYAEAVAFTPDGSRCYIGGRGPARVWDGERLVSFSERHFRSLRVCAESGRVMALDYDGTLFVLAPDGSELQSVSAHTGSARLLPETERGVVSVGVDGWMKVWAASHAEPSFAMRFGERIRGAAWSPSGAHLAIAARRSILILDAVDWREIGRVMSRGVDPASLAFSPDGGTLAVGGADGNVEVVDFSSLLRTSARHCHSAAVYGLAMSRDGRLMASSDGRGTIMIWDLDSELAPERTFEVGTDEIRDIAFDLPGARLGFATDRGRVCVLDVNTGQLESDVQVGIGAVSSSFDDDLKTVVLGDWSGEVARYDVETGRRLAAFPGHGKGIRALLRLRDGRHLVTTDYTGRIRLWDLAEARRRREFEAIPSPINCGALHPSASLLAVGAQDHRVRIVELESGRITATLTGHRHSVVDAVFTATGDRLLTGGFDGTLRVWDPRRGELLLTLSGDGDPVASLARRARDGLVVTGHWSGVVRFWPACR